jgi:hypothetical protein
MIGSSIIDETLRKHGIPEWVKPYIISYARSNPVRAVKYASSFIATGRRKGMITKNEIKLPNGHVFRKGDIMRMLYLFYYGEERISKMSEKWATESPKIDREYAKHFREVSGVESRHARAIKNVIEGFGKGSWKPSKEFVEVFDFVEGLKDCHERLIAKRIVFWYSYRVSFGVVFYRVFYPVAPELLRSVGKIFKGENAQELLGDNEVKEIIKSGKISKDRLRWLARQILARIYNSIQAEMPLARKAKVEKEAQLLCDISLASPLHVLNEMDAGLDVEEELKEIKRLAAQL